MSIESARRKLVSHQQQIVKLQHEKAREAERIAGLTKKAAAASESASRTTKPSVAASKLRECVRYQEDIAGAQKRMSSLEDKIAREQQRASDASRELAREEDRAAQGRLKEEQRRARGHQAAMRAISGTLTKHDNLHREAMTAIEKLRQLPERIVVLFLASNPLDEEQLRLDEEARAIAEMIRKSQHKDAVKLESCWAVRPLDVLQAINEHSPRVVHFSGHGSAQDEILFQDGAGRAKPVTREALVQTMLAASGDIQLVFFNTCFSHGQAEAVVKHVKAAVGMKADIGDEAARVFAAQFYSAVGFGKSVKQAFEQAKAALMLEGIQEQDTPALFLGDGVSGEDLTLVRPPEVAGAG